MTWTHPFRKRNLLAGSQRPSFVLAKLTRGKLSEQSVIPGRWLRSLALIEVFCRTASWLVGRGLSLCARSSVRSTMLEGLGYTHLNPRMTVPPLWHELEMQADLDRDPHLGCSCSITISRAFAGKGVGYDADGSEGP